MIVIENMELQDSLLLVLKIFELHYCKTVKERCKT